VHSGDELEMLADSFNRMAAQLEESYSGLEQRIEERTRELARSLAELQALSEISRAVNSTLDLEQMLATIVARAVQLSDADGGAVYEYDDTLRILHAAHQLDEELIRALQANPMRFGEGLLGRAVMAREPLQLSNLGDAAAYGDLYPQEIRSAMLRSGVRTLLALPLLREQQTVGGLVVGRKRTEQFTAAEIELLQAFATQSALAIHNAQLFRELADQGRQLEQASRHKSQFLANMSHELRTPLNAILGYTELIADGIYGELPEKVHEVLERVSHNGRHLLGLINAVLDLSKIEAGQLTLALGDYKMKDLVYSTVTAVESLAAEKRLALKVELSRDLPPGRGDRQRLGQVLLNLLGNAIKFTDQGEVKITVNATAELFEVAVSDTGPGIAPADQARIFDEFQQVDDSSTRTKGGSGLGLAIARKIINLHGGEIGVESKVGAGSKFWFRLPVQVERQQEAA
jgi:signal transduction histidine kinase